MSDPLVTAWAELCNDDDVDALGTWWHLLSDERGDAFATAAELVETYVCITTGGFDPPPRQCGDAMTNDTKHQTSTSQILRGRLEQVRARHDCGAVSPAMYKAIRAMELEIAWTEHKGEQK